MLFKNLAQKLLISPISEGADTLLVLSGYATPNMASWLISTLQDQRLGPINISLLVGMIPYDGLSVSIHEGFKALHGKSYENAVQNFTCSYIYENPPVHGNLYVWLRNKIPVIAYTGSAEFMQNSFTSPRIEIVESCNPEVAYALFLEIESQSIYCNHNEVEDLIILRPTHQILDAENNPLLTLSGDGIDSVTLSLLTRSGGGWCEIGVELGPARRAKQK